MRVQEHIKLSTAAALVALPWLKKDVWIPLSASILIDSDHYFWHVATQRNLSPRAALRYFKQANPARRSETRLLHHPVILTALALIAAYTRSRILWLTLAGFLFHVSLDTIHGSQIAHLKRTLSAEGGHHCSECGQHCADLQLHTVHFSRSVFTHYRRQHFAVLCPVCHQRAHAPTSQGRCKMQGLPDS